MNTTQGQLKWEEDQVNRDLSPDCVSVKKRAVGCSITTTLAERTAKRSRLAASSTRLIVSEEGAPMTVAMLRRRFDVAREAAGVAKAEFQMRDLRAKAGTDKAESSGDILQARDQPGHTTVVMTEQYIRKRICKKVMPTK